ncbi:MAG: thioredoxin family protein [Methanomassiliicoccales archaeon]
MPKIRLWIEISPLPSKVKIFPLGCAKCRLMEVAAHTAVEESGVDAEVIKI